MSIVIIMNIMTTIMGMKRLVRCSAIFQIITIMMTITTTTITITNTASCPSRVINVKLIYSDVIYDPNLLSVITTTNAL